MTGRRSTGSGLRMAQQQFPSAAEAFRAIATDPGKLRTFTACIGDELHPSRKRIAQLLARWFVDLRASVSASGLQTYGWPRRLSVLDVGCGPAVLRRSLGEQFEPHQLRYVGVDPVLSLLERADCREFSLWDVARDGPLPRLQFDDGWRDLLVAISDDGDPAMVTMAPGESGWNQRLPFSCAVPQFDAVVVRHVLEHLAKPGPLLAECCMLARSKLILVFSQATHATGLDQSLLTDQHLGAPRWSHWRTSVEELVGRLQFDVQAIEAGPPLVPREELWHCVRR